MLHPALCSLKAHIDHQSDQIGEFISTETVSPGDAFGDSVGVPSGTGKMDCLIYIYMKLAWAFKIAIPGCFDHPIKHKIMLHARFIHVHSCHF